MIVSRSILHHLVPSCQRGNPRRRSAIGSPNLDPLELAPLALAAALYLRRTRTLAGRGRPPSRRRGLVFALGLAIVAAALVSPLDRLGATRLLLAHVSQHLLLGDLGPLLLVLGLTGRLLRPLLALRGLGRLRLLAHPLLALPLWAADLFLWHLPAAYQAALRHPALHALEHGLFLATGLAVWAALVEPLPGPAWFGNTWKLGYVGAVRSLETALAYVFLSASAPFYSWYERAPRVAGISPLDDQQLAGSILLVEGMLVTVCLLGWLLARFLSASELRQQLLEAGVDARAADRSARYGRRPGTG